LAASSVGDTVSGVADIRRVQRFTHEGYQIATGRFLQGLAGFAIPCVSHLTEQRIKTRVSNLHLYAHETGFCGVSMPDLTTFVLIAGLAGVAGFTLGYGVRDFISRRRHQVARARRALGMD